MLDKITRQLMSLPLWVAVFVMFVAFTMAKRRGLLSAIGLPA